MKRIFLSIVTLIFLTISGNAQVEPHAIGVRLGGGNFGSGAELNYLHGIGDANRIELGLGLNSLNSSSYMNLVGVYQWVWSLEQGFNWYVGPGAQLLLVKNASAILVGGEVGVEYNFNTNLEVPLLIGLDTRPMFNLGDGDGFGWGVALSIRYTF
jgi:hypothetical protein